MSNKITIQTSLKLTKIFKEKNWTSIDGHKDVLKRFENLIESLKNDEIELVLELTSRFEWYSYNDYNSSLRKLMIQLHDELLNGKISKVYLFAIKKIDDEEDIKSGDVVSYMINGIKPSIQGYEDIEFIILKKFADLNQANLSLNDNEILLLVDDYIGTGKTLDSTLTYLEDNNTIKSNIAVLTAVIQDDARNQLQNLGKSIFYHSSIPKGISNFYEDENLEIKRELMKRIEDRIPKVKNFRFGFEKSEALVSLIRTPNNTFPVFWKDYNRNNQKFKAPFPRY